MDCHSLLQGIFLTQRLNLGLLHCGQILSSEPLKNVININTHIELTWKRQISILSQTKDFTVFPLNRQIFTKKESQAKKRNLEGTSRNLEVMNDTQKMKDNLSCYFILLLLNCRHIFTFFICYSFWQLEICFFVS